MNSKNKEFEPVQSRLKKMYDNRFGEDIEFRNKMYRVLCQDFFQKYIPPDSSVLDLAAGYCEFINNINAKEKIALDLNPDIKKFAASDVRVIESTSTSMEHNKDNSIDVVFTSNFLEHLERADIIKTVQEVHRILKAGGKFLILQPNIRYCYKDYWMFFDHVTPIDDRGLSELLEISGFKITECIPRFLPYTTQGILPKSIALLKIYLKIPILHKIFGKQAFICAEKE